MVTAFSEQTNPSSKAQLARLLTGLIALAATLAGCGEAKPPDPLEVSKLLQPKAAPLCTSVFDSRRAGTSSGSVQAPAIAFLQEDSSRLEQKYRGTPEPFSTWYPYQYYLPSSAHPKSADAVQALVCIRKISIQIGTYQPNNNVAGVRRDWGIRVIRWPSGEPLVGMDVRGEDPPSQAKFSSYTSGSTVTGQDREPEAKRWLDGLFAR